MIQTWKSSSTVLRVLSSDMYFHTLVQKARITRLISPNSFLPRVLEKTDAAASKSVTYSLYSKNC